MIAAQEREALDWVAPNGTHLTLRRIHEGDIDRMLAFVEGLSYSTRYFRYGHGDAQFSREHMARVCADDGQGSVHWLATRATPGGDEEVIGSARVVFSEGSRTCELAIAVKDAWQSQGIGKRLVDLLLEGARSAGQTEIRARILGTNRAMIHFMEGRGFSICDSAEGPWVKLAVCRLTS